MSVIIKSGASSTTASVDTNNNLQVNLPTTATQAGYSQETYVPVSTISKVVQVTDDGAKLVGEQFPLYDIQFNGASTTWAPKIGTNATTMTKAITNGFMRLNSGSGVATTTGISIYTNCVFPVFMEREIHIKFNVKHTNAVATNKQMEWGLGYYNFAAGQANAMNEFIGFRITAGGVLQGVLAYSTGGAPTETTVNVNSGTPFTDGQAKEYELRINNRRVEYWANGSFQNSISIAADVYGIIKAIGYPLIARVFNSGAASAAPILDIGSVSVVTVGAFCDISESTMKAKYDNVSHYFQSDLLTGAGTNPFNFPASGGGATAATGSNTASVLNNTANLGGMFAMNGASVSGANINILISGYQNPSVPAANGAGNNGRNLIITGAIISPMVVTTVLVGGPYVATWFIAIGNTALSLATADADGTTAVAQKAPRLIALSRMTSFAAAAAAGTIETGQGDFSYQFTTPLIVHPGEFVSFGLRVLSATAVSSGVLSGQCYLNGYWE